MSNFYVYVLYSPTVDRYYIGQTQGLGDRLLQHLVGHFPESYTRIAKDWERIFELRCPSRDIALQIEKHIKSMKSRKYVEDLVKYPELSDKLLKRYG